jgi:hypothetical protein
MEGAIEYVVADGCGVKVAVPSDVITGKICTVEFGEEVGVVEKDMGLAGTQANKNIVRHNIAMPDRNCLMQAPSENLSFDRTRESAANHIALSD